MPQFWIFPKVRKEGHPGRLVVSSINCHSTKISKYIDHQLQPHVKELKSYVEDSKNFIWKINSMKKSYWQQHLCNHGYVFLIHKYSKPGRNWSCVNKPEIKIYQKENYLDISPLGFDIYFLSIWIFFHSRRKGRLSL